jgi:hypothetical protein
MKWEDRFVCLTPTSVQVFKNADKPEQGGKAKSTIKLLSSGRVEAVAESEFAEQQLGDPRPFAFSIIPGEGEDELILAGRTEGDFSIWMSALQKRFYDLTTGATPNIASSASSPNQANVSPSSSVTAATTSSVMNTSSPIPINPQAAFVSSPNPPQPQAAIAAAAAASVPSASSSTFLPPPPLPINSGMMTPVAPVTSSTYYTPNTTTTTTTNNNMTSAVVAPVSTRQVIQPRITQEVSIPSTSVPGTTSTSTSFASSSTATRSAVGDRVESGFLPPVEAPKRPNNRDLDMALVQEANNRVSKATGSRVKGKITEDLPDAPPRPPERGGVSVPLPPSSFAATNAELSKSGMRAHIPSSAIVTHGMEIPAPKFKAWAGTGGMAAMAAPDVLIPPPGSHKPRVPGAGTVAAAGGLTSPGFQYSIDPLGPSPMRSYPTKGGLGRSAPGDDDDDNLSTVGSIAGIPTTQTLGGGTGQARGVTFAADVTPDTSPPPKVQPAPLGLTVTDDAPQYSYPRMGGVGPSSSSSSSSSSSFSSGMMPSTTSSMFPLSSGVSSNAGANNIGAGAGGGLSRPILQQRTRNAAPSAIPATAREGTPYAAPSPAVVSSYASSAYAVSSAAAAAERASQSAAAQSAFYAPNTVDNTPTRTGGSSNIVDSSVAAQQSTTTTTTIPAETAIPPPDNRLASENVVLHMTNDAVERAMQAANSAAAEVAAIFDHRNAASDFRAAAASISAQQQNTYYYDNLDEGADGRPRGLSLDNDGLAALDDVNIDNRSVDTTPYVVPTSTNLRGGRSISEPSYRDNETVYTAETLRTVGGTALAFQPLKVVPMKEVRRAFDFATAHSEGLLQLDKLPALVESLGLPLDENRITYSSSTGAAELDAETLRELGLDQYQARLLSRADFMAWWKRHAVARVKQLEAEVLRRNALQAARDLEAGGVSSASAAAAARRGRNEYTGSSRRSASRNRNNNYNGGGVPTDADDAETINTYATFNDAETAVTRETFETQSTFAAINRSQQAQRFLSESAAANAAKEASLQLASVLQRVEEGCEVTTRSAQATLTELGGTVPEQQSSSSKSRLSGPGYEERKVADGKEDVFGAPGSSANRGAASSSSSSSSMQLVIPPWLSKYSTTRAAAAAATVSGVAPVTVPSTGVSSSPNAVLPATPSAATVVLASHSVPARSSSIKGTPLTAPPKDNTNTAIKSLATRDAMTRLFGSTPSNDSSSSSSSREETVKDASLGLALGMQRRIGDIVAAAVSTAVVGTNAEAVEKLKMFQAMHTDSSAFSHCVPLPINAALSSLLTDAESAEAINVTKELPIAATSEGFGLLHDLSGMDPSVLSLTSTDGTGKADLNVMYTDIMEAPFPEGDGDLNEEWQRVHEEKAQNVFQALCKAVKVYTVLNRFSAVAAEACSKIVSELGVPDELKTLPPLSHLLRTRAEAEGEPDIGSAGVGVYMYKGLLIRFALGSGNVIADHFSSNGVSQTSSIAAMEEDISASAYEKLPYSVDTLERKIAGHTMRNMRLVVDSCMEIAVMENAANGQVGPVPAIASILTSLVDFSGFRFYAVAVPPIDEDETLVFGKRSGAGSGENVQFTQHQTDPDLALLLRKVGKALNLKPHAVVDQSGTYLIPLSVDVQGHQCSDSRFYLLNLSRLLPSDVAPLNAATFYPPELEQAYPPSTNADALMNQLRPEFVLGYGVSSRNALSSDAYRGGKKPKGDQLPLALSIGDAPDHVANDLECGRASMALRVSSVTALVKSLGGLSCQSSPLSSAALANAEYLESCAGMGAVDSLAITQHMHTAGVNSRYLGSVAALAKSMQLPHLKEAAECEMVARTMKHMLGLNMRRTAVHAAKLVSQKVAASNTKEEAEEAVESGKKLLSDALSTCAIDLCNLLLGRSEDARSFWRDAVCPAVFTKFGYALPPPVGLEEDYDAINEAAIAAAIASGSSSSSLDALPSVALPFQSSTQHHLPLHPLQLFFAVSHHCGISFALDLPPSPELSTSSISTSSAKNASLPPNLGLPAGSMSRYDFLRAEPFSTTDLTRPVGLDSGAGSLRPLFPGRALETSPGLLPASGDDLLSDALESRARGADAASVSSSLAAAVHAFQVRLALLQCFGAAESSTTSNTESAQAHLEIARAYLSAGDVEGVHLSVLSVLERVSGRHILAGRALLMRSIALILQAASSKVGTTAAANFESQADASYSSALLAATSHLGKSHPILADFHATYAIAIYSFLQRTNKAAEIMAQAVNVASLVLPSTHAMLPLFFAACGHMQRRVAAEQGGNSLAILSKASVSFERALGLLEANVPESGEGPAVSAAQALAGSCNAALADTLALQGKLSLALSAAKRALSLRESSLLNGYLDKKDHQGRVFKDAPRRDLLQLSILESQLQTSSLLDRVCTTAGSSSDVAATVSEASKHLVPVFVAVKSAASLNPTEANAARVQRVAKHIVRLRLLSLPASHRAALQSLVKRREDAHPGASSAPTAMAFVVKALLSAGAASNEESTSSSSSSSSFASPAAFVDHVASSCLSALGVTSSSPHPELLISSTPGQGQQPSLADQLTCLVGLLADGAASTGGDITSDSGTSSTSTIGLAAATLAEKKKVVSSMQSPTSRSLAENARDVLLFTISSASSGQGNALPLLTRIAVGGPLSLESVIASL